MNTTRTRIIAFAAVAALTIGLAPQAALAQQAAAPKAFPGRITRTDGQQLQGSIRWMPQGRRYVVSVRRPDGQTIDTPVPAGEVRKVEVPKPEKLDAAIRAVQAGKGSAAIPVLEQIVSQYAMMGWDEPAARYLAKARIDAGDAAGAIKICEDIIKAKPSAAYLGDVAPIYWQALLKTDKQAKLNELITKAISNGDRAASAAALVMRGDILMEQKQPMEALKDGYLRAVILYENVREVQPEALFKAAKAFEAVSQNARAEKMRSTLRAKYPKSEYAAKL